MYKTNRVNHDFQIAYFIAGACHTPDAAWSTMCDLEEDRVRALQLAQGQALRTQARLLRAQAVIDSDTATEADKLEARADVLDIENDREISERNIRAAEAELKTIRRIKQELEPLRRFAHLPDHEANEAAQYEEWKLHLLWTAQNQMLSTGTVAHDYLATMRLHPEFNSTMLPLIDQWRRDMLKVGSTGGDLASLSWVAKPQYGALAAQDQIKALLAGPGQDPGQANNGDQ